MDCHSLPPSILWLHEWSKSSVAEKLTIIHAADQNIHSDVSWLTQRVNKLPSPSQILLDREELLQACSESSSQHLIAMLEEYIRELIRLAIEIGHKEHWTYAASSCDVLDIVTRALCCELSCYKKDLAVFYQARNRSYMLLPDDVRYSQTEELYPSLFSNFGLLDRCLVHRLCFNYSEMMPDKLAMKLGLHSLIGDIAEDRLKARRETQSGMLEVYATVSNVDQRELDKPLLVLL